MNFSPIRSKLMNTEITPSKIVVNYDINGWMETNLKKNMQQPPKPKHCERRILSKKSEPKEFSNIASLKERRRQLLDSNRKMPSAHAVCRT